MIFTVVREFTWLFLETYLFPNYEKLLFPEVSFTHSRFFQENGQKFKFDALGLENQIFRKSYRLGQF